MRHAATAGLAGAILVLSGTAAAQGYPTGLAALQQGALNLLGDLNLVLVPVAIGLLLAQQRTVPATAGAAAIALATVLAQAVILSGGRPTGLVTAVLTSALMAGAATALGWPLPRPAVLALAAAGSAAVGFFSAPLPQPRFFWSTVIMASGTTLCITAIAMLIRTLAVVAIGGARYGTWTRIGHIGLRVLGSWIAAIAALELALLLAR